jgi:hypothetical protein
MRRGWSEPLENGGATAALLAFLLVAIGGIAPLVAVDVPAPYK